MSRVNDLTDDLLVGVSAIATFLRWPNRRVLHQHEHRLLPTFKQGRLVCARKSELETHLARGTGGMVIAGRARAEPKPVPKPDSSPPDMLCGHRAIAGHLGLPIEDVARLDAERRLPTYQDDGCTVASAAALDHWNMMKGGR